MFELYTNSLWGKKKKNCKLTKKKSKLSQHPRPLFIFLIMSPYLICMGI